MKQINKFASVYKSVIPCGKVDILKINSLILVTKIAFQSADVLNRAGSKTPLLTPAKLEKLNGLIIHFLLYFYA